MPDTYEEISERRKKLLSACEVFPSPRLGKMLRTSNADDLEWFLGQIESQLDEAPHLVKDPDALKKRLENFRILRIGVLGRLGDRRSAEKLVDYKQTRFRANISMWISAIGLLFAFIALMISIFK